MEVTGTGRSDLTPDFDTRARLPQSRVGPLAFYKLDADNNPASEGHRVPCSDPEYHFLQWPPLQLDDGVPGIAGLDLGLTAHVDHAHDHFLGNVV